MKILVTGGLGTVGTPLVNELRSRGNSIWVCDLSHTHYEQYTRCDISEYRQLERIILVHKFDFVFNLAAEFGRWNGELAYENLWSTNVIGMKHLLRLQNKYRFRLVHFSSSEIYGDFRGEMYESVPLDHPLLPLNDYAMTKLVNEWQIRNESILNGTETVVVRLFNTYGPGEFFTPYRSVIARFCYYALHSKPYTVHLGHKRSFSYIDDTVNSIANIVTSFVPGDVYNIGDSTQYSIKDVSDLIQKECGIVSSLVNYEDKEELTTTEKMINNHQARTRLGYKQSVSLEEGIAHTVAWMRQVYGK